MTLHVSYFVLSPYVLHFFRQLAWGHLRPNTFLTWQHENRRIFHYVWQITQLLLPKLQQGRLFSIFFDLFLMSFRYLFVMIILDTIVHRQLVMFIVRSVVQAFFAKNRYNQIHLQFQLSEVARPAIGTLMSEIRNSVLKENRRTDGILQRCELVW